MRSGLTLTALCFCATRLVSAQAVPRVVDFSLVDAAVAVADPARPVIYYNPVILARTGPAMSTFIMAHEEAHIQLRHLRAALSRGEAARLRRLELEADCHAARALAVDAPEAVRAAVAFFGALGATRVDEEHPSGIERARRIVSCAAKHEPGEATKPRPVRADIVELPDVS